MRPIGTPEGLRRRRLRAVEVVEPGGSPADVARFLGGGRSSVDTRVELARGDLARLAAKPHAGPKPRLDDGPLAELEGPLRRGAKAHGRRTEPWAAGRAAELIGRHFGVASHPEHGRKVLERRPRWTSRKPRRRARERDEVAIAHRRAQDRPRIIRRARRRQAHLVLLDEPGSMLTPTVRRTLAPRGKTPALRGRGRHDRISAIGALVVSPSRRRLGRHYRLLPDDADVHGEDTVASLRERRRRPPVPMTILWGRGNVHDRPKAVRAHPAEHPAIEAEPSPGYTPGANPDEGAWGHTEHGRPADFAPEDTAELRSEWVRELGRSHRRPRLLASFIRHAAIPIRLRL